VGVVLGWVCRVAVGREVVCTVVRLDVGGGVGVGAALGAFTVTDKTVELVTAPALYVTCKIKF
jgi:hypothetical protein